MKIKLKKIAAAASLVAASGAFAQFAPSPNTAVFQADSNNDGGGKYGQLLGGSGTNATAVTAFSPGPSATLDEANGEGSLQMQSSGYTQVVVDVNEDRSGGFYVWSANGSGNSVNMISSTAQSTILQAGNTNGSSTTGRIAVTDGATSINHDINASTSINTGTSTGNVVIGNANNITTIQSGTNNITGVTNNITASGTNSANNITGTTNVNTTGTATTTIGNNSNAANVTNINSTTNNMGAGYASTNNIGTGTAASTTNIGNANAAVNVNGTTKINENINAATSINTGTSTGLVTIGNSSNANNTVNILGTRNNIGTDAVATTNRIGNTQTGTTVTSTAGNASQSLANNSANTLVTGGTSGLTTRTSVANVTTNAQVLLQNSGGTTVDANGKIITAGSTGYVAPTAPTAAVTLTNGYGNTHGMVVTESQTTLSGGTQSSSLTLNDTHARFSRASNGAPITVTGVADGRDDFDAVNVRQFAGAVAAVSAQSNIPGLQQGQDKSIGVGLGNFMGKTALGVGLNYRGEKTGVYRLSVATGMNGGAKPVVGAGAAWSF